MRSGKEERDREREEDGKNSRRSGNYADSHRLRRKKGKKKEEGAVARRFVLCEE